MTTRNYSVGNFVFTINGRPIEDWGDSPTPYRDEPIDPKSVLRRGRGGRALRLDRKNPGRRITVSLNPGGADSAFIQGLFNSNANINLGYAQVGTLEGAVGAEGVIVNDGAVDRGGETVSDDVYIIECNVWTASKGGA